MKVGCFARVLVFEDGVVSVEYAVMAMMVALVIVAGAMTLGLNLNALYESVVNKFPAVPSA